MGVTDPARRLQPRPQTEVQREAALDERAARARALAPAYDYIRALVAQWEAEDRERASRGEDQTG